MAQLKIQMIIKQPLEFYVKWIATFIALGTVYCTSHDIIPLNKYFGLTAAILWGWLGILWKQPSMLILNMIMSALYIKGMFFL